MLEQFPGSKKITQRRGPPSQVRALQLDIYMLLKRTNRITLFSSAYEHFEFRPSPRLPYRTTYSKLVEAAPLAPRALDATERKLTSIQTLLHYYKHIWAI